MLFIFRMANLGRSCRAFAIRNAPNRLQRTTSGLEMPKVFEGEKPRSEWLTPRQEKDPAYDLKSERGLIGAI